MATLRITNLTSSAYYLNDIYTSVPASSYVDVLRSPAEVSSMAGLAAAVADGVLSVAVTYSADELAAKNTVGGMLGSLLVPGTVPAPVAASATVGQLVSLRIPLTATGASGTLIDTTVYALNTLPYKMRVVDAFARITTAGPGSSTFDVRSQAAGAGTLAARIPSDVAGRFDMTLPTASEVLTPGASVGLFVRRDRSTVAELFVTVRVEA